MLQSPYLENYHFGNGKIIFQRLLPVTFNICSCCSHFQNSRALVIVTKNQLQKMHVLKATRFYSRAFLISRYLLRIVCSIFAILLRFLK